MTKIENIYQIQLFRYWNRSRIVIYSMQAEFSHMYITIVQEALTIEDFTKFIVLNKAGD